MKPVKAVQVDKTVQGVLYDYYEGKWDSLPDFEQLKSIKNGSLPNFYFAPGYQTDYFGFRYSGFIQIPEDGVYFFYTDSDDGNQLYIGDLLIVNNDGLHGMEEVEGVIALEAGFHPIRLLFFEKTGGEGLRVFIKGPGIKKMRLADYMLFYEK